MSQQIPGSAQHDEIEALIDRYSLCDVFEVVAQVCRDKAEHLRHSWQDAESGHRWDRAANKLDSLCANAIVKSL